MWGGISPVDIVEELPLYVTQQTTGSNSEQVSTQPLISELFFHHRHPRQRILGTANSSGWFEANLQQGEIWCMLLLLVK